MARIGTGLRMPGVLATSDPAEKRLRECVGEWGRWRGWRTAFSRYNQRDQGQTSKRDPSDLPGEQLKARPPPASGGEHAAPHLGLRTSPHFHSFPHNWPLSINWHSLHTFLERYFSREVALLTYLWKVKVCILYEKIQLASYCKKKLITEMC